MKANGIALIVLSLIAGCMKSVTAVQKTVKPPAPTSHLEEILVREAERDQMRQTEARTFVKENRKGDHKHLIFLTELTRPHVGVVTYQQAGTSAKEIARFNVDDRRHHPAVPEQFGNCLIGSWLAAPGKK